MLVCQEYFNVLEFKQMIILFNHLFLLQHNNTQFIAVPKNTDKPICYLPFLWKVSIISSLKIIQTITTAIRCARSLYAKTLKWLNCTSLNQCLCKPLFFFFENCLSPGVQKKHSWCRLQLWQLTMALGSVFNNNTETLYNLDSDKITFGSGKFYFLSLTGY